MERPGIQRVDHVDTQTRVTLDPAQSAILSALTLRARATYSLLARELNLSRQMVKYHLDDLEERGVVEGYYAILNVVRLGYHYHRVLIRFGNVRPSTEQRIIEWFEQDPRVGWVVEHQGTWHAAIAVWTRTMFEFETFVDDMLTFAGSHIEDKLISYSMRIYHLKNKYLRGENDDEALIVGGDVEEVSNDKLDYDVLSILAKTARASYVEMGTQLDVDPKVIQYRIRRLMDQGVILGFNVKLNHNLLGFTMHKVFMKLTSISKADMDRLIGDLRKRSNVVCITKSIGFSDLEFECMVSSNEELNVTIKELRYSFPELIRDVWSLIVSRESYVNYLPGGV